MDKLLTKLSAFVLCACFGMAAQAGHLFTQADLNTPIDLSAGFGITLPQLALEGASPGTGSNFNVVEFGSGDVMRASLGGLTFVFDFDNMPAGWTATSTLIVSNPNDPSIAALNLTPPFNWRVEALAGSFTLEGFRLYMSNGTVDGTNVDTVNQSGVTPSGPVSAIPVFSPLQLALLILGLIGLVAVRRKFAGTSGA